MGAGSLDTVTAPVDLETEFDVVAGHLNAQHARLVELTVALLADESSWVEAGVHTPELYLAWRTGLSPHRARQIVAIARRVDELPLSFEAFRRGELAVDQMAAIARRAPWWTDREICELAPMLAVAQLNRALSRYPFPEIPNPDAPPAPEVEADSPDADSADDEPPTADSGAGESRPAPPVDRLTYGVGDDDRFRLSLETDQLTGMVIEAALREARDSLFHAGTTDVDGVDALREIAERSLDSITDPARRDRYRIHVHLRTDGTASDRLDRTIPDAIRHYLTCDGYLTPTFIDGSIPISVGRTQRMIPQRTRRTVLRRDQGCRIPGCTAEHHLEIHHIIHWENGGPTDTWNLVALCPHHHRLHHRGELEISGNADTAEGLSITNRHGRPLAGSGARPEPPGAPPPPPAGSYQHPLGERLESKWLYFNPPPEHRPRLAHPHSSPN